MKCFAAGLCIAVLSSSCATGFRPSKETRAWCADYRSVMSGQGREAAVSRLDLFYTARDWPVAAYTSCKLDVDVARDQADADARFIVENVRDNASALRLAGWRFATHGDWKQSAEARCRARELDDSYTVELLCGSSLVQSGDASAGIAVLKEAYWKAPNKEARFHILNAIEEASPDPDRDLDGIPPAVVTAWREERAEQREEAREKARLAAEQQAAPNRIERRRQAERERDEAQSAKQRRICEAQCQAEEQRCQLRGGDYVACSEEKRACTTPCSAY